MDDTISRADAIDAVRKNTFRLTFAEEQNCEGRVAWSADAVYSDVIESALRELPSAQPERLTDDDFETIRIHLDACKEKLCNQGRWKEAKEYQRIYDRFMAFASAQPERDIPLDYIIDEGGNAICPKCGAEMTGVKDD